MHNLLKSVPRRYISTIKPSRQQRSAALTALQGKMSNTPAFNFSSSRDPQVDYYRVLDVPTDCSQEKIREQYLELERLYQPDVFNNGFNNKKLRQIREAFDIIGKDEDVRREYNQAHNMIDHYKVLGVPRGATQKQIHEQYLQMGRMYYPDFFNNGFNDHKFDQIKRSYEALIGSVEERDFESSAWGHLALDPEDHRTEFLVEGDQIQKTTWTNDGNLTKLTVSNWNEDLQVRTEQRLDGDQAQKTTWTNNGKYLKMNVTNWQEPTKVDEDLLQTRTETRVDGDQAQKTTWTNNGKFIKLNVSNWNETKDEDLQVRTEHRLDGDQAQKTTWTNNGKFTKITVSNWNQDLQKRTEFRLDGNQAQKTTWTNNRKFATINVSNWKEAREEDHQQMETEYLTDGSQVQKTTWTNNGKCAKITISNWKPNEAK